MHETFPSYIKCVSLVLLLITWYPGLITKFIWVTVLVQAQGPTPADGFTVSRVLRQYRVLWCGRQRTRLRPLVSLLQPLGSNLSLQYCDLFWFPPLLKSLTSRYITWLSFSPWRWTLSPRMSSGENKLYPQDRDESFQKPWTSLREE